MTSEQWKNGLKNWKISLTEHLYSDNFNSNKKNTGMCRDSEWKMSATLTEIMRQASASVDLNIE